MFVLGDFLMMSKDPVLRFVSLFPLQSYNIGFNLGDAEWLQLRQRGGK